MSGNTLNVSTVGAVSFNGTEFTSGVLPIAYGGTNANAFSVTNGIAVYDGSKLATFTGPQISSGGFYTNTKQPAFLAQAAGTLSSVSGDGTLYTVPFATELFDVNNDFNTGTSTFTAPVQGRYYFNAQVFRINSNTSTTNSLFINCTRPTLTNIAYTTQRAIFSSEDTLSVSALVYLETADTVTVVYQASGGALDIDLFDGTTSLYTSFSGHLIC